MARLLGVVQIDAVNVLVRSHYLPHFARLGAYDTNLLDALAYRDHDLFEYHGHAASLLTVDHHRLMRWRMERHRRESWEPTREAIEAKRPGYVDAALAEIRERGPLSWTDLADSGREQKRQTKYAESSIAWWRWSVGKDVLTHLAHVGDLAVAGRRNFEALYDLAERVVPADVLATPTPSEEDAHRELVRRAAAALGVGTAKDIADYYRLPVATTKARLRELAEAGAVAAVRVEGWKDPGWMNAAAKVPRSCEAHALLSPFDSLIWERKRTERIFGFRVSFEIYVPPPKRAYGYFVLAFLMGDAIVARVDLKADRAHKTLLVPGAFLEPGCDKKRVVDALRLQVGELATWLGLEQIEIGSNGDLAGPLKRAVKSFAG
ncbi:MAG TPA: crosslink repair DNA glycosylase YcaQ family protein [Acidimicrobiales bacterium]|nr:crosslink repair DNA glycosylase YcaQ family protein [Acidimicrobiales bacterium]